jgi:hypothetical protein
LALLLPFPKEAQSPLYEGFASSICHNPTFMKAATVLLLLLVLLLLSREVKMYLFHIETRGNEIKAINTAIRHLVLTIRISRRNSSLYGKNAYIASTLIVGGAFTKDPLLKSRG